MASGNLIQPYQGGTILNPFGPNGGAQGTRVNFQFWQQPVFQQSDGTLYCPGFDGPTYAANPYDFVIIAGSKTPGIARVRVKKGRDLDQKKAAGKNNGRLTAHGLKLAEIDIEISVWTPEQVKQLGILWNNVFLHPSVAQVVTVASNPNPLAGAAQAAQLAFDFQHPEIGRHGVASAVIIDGSGIDIDGNRVGRFVIRAVEYAQNSTTTVTQTAAGAQAQPLGTIYPPMSTPGSTASNLGP